MDEAWKKGMKITKKELREVKISALEVSAQRKIRGMEMEKPKKMKKTPKNGKNKQKKAAWKSQKEKQNIPIIPKSMRS